MTEYWEITHARATATLTVWDMADGFTLKNLTLAAHSADDAQLPALAQQRASAELAIANARAQKDDTLALLHQANSRVPGLIEAIIGDEDDLHDELDLVFGVTLSAHSAGQTLRRARLLKGVWEKFNLANPAAQVNISWKPDPDETAQSINVTGFAGAILAVEGLLTAIAEMQRNLASVRSTLRTTERRVDRHNKRWYAGWTKLFPEGTPEGDAARSQVPTELGVPLAQPLEITGAVPQPGSMLLVSLDPNTGAHATTRELLRQLPGDVDFGNAVPISADTVLIGPIPSGTLVKLRTRNANSNPGVVWSAIFQLVMP